MKGHFLAGLRGINICCAELRSLGTAYGYLQASVVPWVWGESVTALWEKLGFVDIAVRRSFYH